MMLTGDNGILTRAGETKTKTIHAAVLEQMLLEANAYTFDKTTGKYSNSLIDYLKGKSILSDISGEENKWLIDVATLLGSNQPMGNGTYPSDVYVLEKDTTTGNISNLKIASTNPIRIAEVTNTNVDYKVVYYGTSVTDLVILGKLGIGDAGTVASSGIDWDAAKTKATSKFEGQTQTNDIGIGTDGELVNLDYWRYSKTNGTIALGGYSESYDYTHGYAYGSLVITHGYIGSIVDGKIVGKVPQYIKLENDEWLPVTDISTCFKGITSLVVGPELPTTITKIPVDAFNGCTSLTSITIPGSVNSIESNAFKDCTRLSNVTIGDGVARIEGGAFYNCDSLRTIYFPSSVTTVGGERWGTSPFMYGRNKYSILWGR